MQKINQLLAIVLMIVSSTLQLSAQNTTNEPNIVKLNDGSVLIGTSIVIGDSTFVTMSNGKIFAVHSNRVKRIRDANDVRVFSSGKFQFKKGLYKSFSVTTKPGSYSGSLMFDGQIGIRPTEKLSIGLGIGRRYFFDEVLSDTDSDDVYTMNSGWFTNVSGYMRYTLLDGPMQLYTGISLGYSWAGRAGTFAEFAGTLSGGVSSRPHLGLTFPSYSGTKLYMELGRTFQQYKVNLVDPPLNVPNLRNRWFNSSDLTIGIRFN